MDSAEIDRRLRETLHETDGRLLAAYLFGSVARDEEGPGSDVDVGILLREAAPGRLVDLRFELEGRLERALGRTAQVVVLNDAPPDLVHRVLRDGRLLLDRDRSARIRFEVRSRNELFDVQPILDRYRRRASATT